MQKTIIFEAYENYIGDDETRLFLIENSGRSVIVHSDSWDESVVSRYEKSKQFTIPNSLFMHHEINNESHDSHEVSHESVGSPRLLVVLGLVIAITIWVFFLNNNMATKTNIQIESEKYISRIETLSNLLEDQKNLKTEREKIRLSIEKNISEVQKIEQEIESIKNKMIEETNILKK